MSLPRLPVKLSVSTVTKIDIVLMQTQTFLDTIVPYVHVHRVSYRLNCFQVKRIRNQAIDYCSGRLEFLVTNGQACSIPEHGFHGCTMSICGIVAQRAMRGNPASLSPRVSVLQPTYLDDA